MEKTAAPFDVSNIFPTAYIDILKLIDTYYYNLIVRRKWQMIRKITTFHWI